MPCNPAKKISAYNPSTSQFLSNVGNSSDSLVARVSTTWSLDRCAFALIKAPPMAPRTNASDEVSVSQRYPRAPWALAKFKRRWQGLSRIYKLQFGVCPWVVSHGLPTRSETSQSEFLTFSHVLYFLHLGYHGYAP